MPFTCVTLVRPRNHALEEVQIIQRKGAMVGGCLAHWKALRIVAAVYAAKTSVTASARLLQPTVSLSNGRCYVNFSPVKNPPSAMQTVVKRSTCWFFDDFNDRFLFLMKRWDFLRSPCRRWALVTAVSACSDATNASSTPEIRRDSSLDADVGKKSQPAASDVVQIRFQQHLVYHQWRTPLEGPPL